MTPPCRSLLRRATSRLPAPSTRTFGRETDSLAVAALLRRADVRLVTLVGPGGVGKTRLALEAARELEPELAHGAWFASLAATAKPEHVASAIAQALDVKLLEGETAEGALQRFLARKHGLLLLDNCEHLLTAAPVIGDLVHAGEALTVLATSREPLRLKAEQCYPVSPLQVPTEPQLVAVEESAAGSLFVERARSHDRSFELTDDNAAAIAEICRRLDGLPLALELAAARTTMLDVEELSARLADALDVLAEGPRDAPDRQRTLRATIDWSHRLLSSKEARAFARFAVFVGGATFEAAQAVTAAELDELQGLVDKQLLRREGSGKEARLTMLETVRGYALERLEERRPTKRATDIAITTSGSSNAPSRSCSPVVRPSGCPSSTSRSTTFGRLWNGASTTIRRSRCVWRECSSSSGLSAPNTSRVSNGCKRPSPLPATMLPQLTGRGHEERRRVSSAHTEPHTTGRARGGN